MDDQIENLKSYGLDRATAVHSGNEIGAREQVLQMCGTGHYQLVYVSPERFQISSFRESLLNINYAFFSFFGSDRRGSLCFRMGARL